jgi:hypothetical protein
MSRNLSRVTTKRTDDSQHPFNDVEANRNVNNSNESRLSTSETSKSELTSEDALTLKHFKYNPSTNKLEGSKAIETTLNSLFLGEQHKMSSGAENIFFTNLGSEINFFPMWGGLKDQSKVENQGASGFIAPSGRVYTDMQTDVPNGDSVNGTSIAYSGDTLYNENIAGLGVKVVLAEPINHNTTYLRYRLSVAGKQVYLQEFRPTYTYSVGDSIEWFFDHPVEIHSGTTIFAEVVKMDINTDESKGVLLVTKGDAIGNPRHIEVFNRYFEDKDLELISPYLKYQAIDVSLDPTGSTIIFKDLSLGSDNVLSSYPINTLEALANGSTIKLKVKDGQKVIIESLPVGNVSVGGSLVNSVLNQAVTQLNNIFTNTDGFASGGGNPVTNFDLSNNDLTLTLEDGTSYTIDVTTLGVDENKFVNSGALNGSNLELTMNDSSVITIDASNMINGSTLPALSSNWYISYGGSSGDEITSPAIINTYENKQPFYYGSFLGKGQEYTWTHDDNGYYIIGVYSGSESTKDEVEITYNINWSTMFRFTKIGTNRVSETSFGVDVASRYASGYNVTNNTTLALRYGTDNYLSLYDISGSDEVLIGRSNTALVGDTQTISFGGQNQPNAKFPIIIKREIQWSIAHDYDNSETSISDGIEEDTILKSNISIGAGEKFMINLNYFGRSEFFGIGYTGASSGQSNPYTNLDSWFRYTSSEAIVSGGDWTFNTNATNYSTAGGGSYSLGGNVNIGMLSLVYNTDNSLDLYHEGVGEVIMTRTSNLDGNNIHLFFMANESHAYGRIPTPSKQTINAGSQPITSFAPDVSDQVLEITEGQVFSSQIALDSGSDIVNMYGEEDAPSWAILNQSTGVFTGTAPSYLGSSDDYIISCKASNSLGGITSFNVTLRVLELTYTNTKSLKFRDGVSSYLGANASLVTSLERSSNGSGSLDAWTISLWIKGSTENAGQTIFYFGNNDVVNNGHIEIRQTNHNGAKRLRLRYGSNSNHIQLTTPSGSITPSSWQHVMLSYNGGTTGVASGSVTDYYSRFKFYIDGVLQTTSNSHANNGYSGSVVGQNFRIGRLASGNYPKDMLVNQIAIWNSDESSNISDIYNSGSSQDLSLLSSAPEHYYEIESSVTTIQDIIGTAHLVGYNFTSSDLINDAP